MYLHTVYSVYNKSIVGEVQDCCTSYKVFSVSNSVSYVNYLYS